ncbi:hypothetical protein M3398_31720 [Streptomyces albidoflavus]|uniref:hypothetical protein n=1 Tax=Streptomyces albidoflavus TaxID=1886 RepID=UPI0020BD8390|nr:hypothetical protein [Streptomyces albidoflavus]MCL6281826.1 hypothetical protein [Streptomyces albidoflavus]
MPAIPPVAYLADGTPVYATGAPGAELIHHQAAPAAPVVIAPAVTHHPLPHPVPAPAPVRDPWPARLLCGGVGVGAAGLGLGVLLEAVAAATTGLALLLGVLLIAGVLLRGGGRGSVRVNVTQRQGR